MPRPFTTVATAQTPDGKLVLQQRDVRDFLITHNGLVLMNSLAHRSEQMLGTVACEPLKDRKAPRVLVGGLGMGITLRAILDVLPADAEVTVAELNPVIVEWCKGPLAIVSGDAVSDPRVTITIADVAKVISAAAETAQTWDAIVIDLYVGPDANTRARDPLYGIKASERAFRALNPTSMYTVWGEHFHEGYAETLERAGFAVRHLRPGKGGMRHVVYIGTRGNQ